MCDHENREAAMVTIEPGIWCDPCIEPVVRALNAVGLRTVASCCGHGHRPSRISLSGGQTVFLLPDAEWDDAVSAFLHVRVGCKPGRECERCADATARPPSMVRCASIHVHDAGCIQDGNDDWWRVAIRPGTEAP